MLLGKEEEKEREKSLRVSCYAGLQLNACKNCDKGGFWWFLSIWCTLVCVCVGLVVAKLIAMAGMTLSCRWFHAISLATETGSFVDAPHNLDLSLFLHPTNIPIGQWWSSSHCFGTKGHFPVSQTRRGNNKECLTNETNRAKSDVRKTKLPSHVRCWVLVLRKNRPP